MGNSKSRNASSSTVDVRSHQTRRRQQVDTESQRIDKDTARRQRSAEQMAALRSPLAPFVPKRGGTTAEGAAAVETATTAALLPLADYDAEAKRRMQDQLAYDSQTFVLNQLLLSVQFFDNYERYAVVPPCGVTIAREWRAISCLFVESAYAIAYVCFVFVV